MKRRTSVQVELPTVALVSLLSMACATAGSTWMEQPMHEHTESEAPSRFVPPERDERRPVRSLRSHRIGVETETYHPEQLALRTALATVEGDAFGRFRNTYYHIPSETSYTGESVSLFNAECRPIKSVPREFFDSLCVQGSGLLSSGMVVSFAKRDCSCAEVCPKTGQKICFDGLDKEQFPWGRGATGKAIVPLLTVAVDSEVIPLMTAVYIPEYDGLPRDASRSSFHDGCFVAQDRGLKVKGRHVDIFTGAPAMTDLWNRLVPSNQGVTVIVGSSRCAR